MTKRSKKRVISGLLFTLLCISFTGYLLVRYSFERIEPVYPPLPRSYDIIVVGSGLSGKLTAIAAAMQNADVLYIHQNEPEAGGIPAYLPAFWAAETNIQEKAEIDYLSETMAQEIYQRTGESGSFAQILQISRLSAESMQWLETLTKQTFSKLDTENPGLHIGPEDIFETAQKQLAVLLEEVVTEHNTMDLPLRLLTDDHKVYGLLVKNKEGSEEEVFAHAVILADGGYASNQELLFSLTGIKGVIDRFDGGHQGKGLRLAQEAGAKTQNLDQVWLAPITLATGKTVNVRDAENILFFNTSGLPVERLDTLEETLLAAGGKLFLVSAANAPLTADNLEPVSVNDINQLARILKTDPVVLNEQIQELEPPYQVSVLGVTALTPGGITVQENYQVIGEAGPITGLYAAGELTGGLHGNTAVAELFFAETVISSRLAGVNAAAYARR